MMISAIPLQTVPINCLLQYVHIITQNTYSIFLANEDLYLLCFYLYWETEVLLYWGNCTGKIMSSLEHRGIRMFFRGKTDIKV